LQAWLPKPAADTGSFTRLSHWNKKEWVIDFDGLWYDNDKRAAFYPYLDLPKKINVPLSYPFAIEVVENFTFLFSSFTPKSQNFKFLPATNIYKLIFSKIQILRKDYRSNKKQYIKE